MILECPNCETRYEIPAEIPPEGRKVRCSSCEHVWQATPENQPKQDVSLPTFDDEEIVFKDDSGNEATPDVGTDAGSNAESGSELDEGKAAEQTTEGLAAEADAFSETAMEEAFTAAMDESATESAETDADANLPAEVAESPPIVIGKAKRRSVDMFGPVPAGWAALVLLVAGLGAYVYFQRVDVVRAFPGAAAAYERMGLPVNVRGLEFDKVQYSWETSAGRQVLEVHGEIINVTSEPLKVPTIVFGLRTKEKVEVYQWAADVRSELLPANQRTAFSAHIPTPPKSIRDVLVRFAKVR